MNTEQSSEGKDPDKLGKNEPVSIVETNELRIPVIEEKVTVGKTVVETGRVTITKRVEESEETVNVPLKEESVTVERRTVNEYVDQAPAVRTEGETTIYPVIKEVLVVEKRLMLIEEIHVTRQQKTNIFEEKISLKKESVSVDREAE